ncbi:hypothetical protein JAO76_16460 [Pontibacter sp. BT310]|uniref:Glycosyltransferase subfamily 4-like N-terminal domain-containing protein n=1 Tax=Pontibacter populi TaxID=890055 RepID=A0ABS6XFA5_9BACT|nr:MULTISPECIES: hypothetical protein [Pontibacter]MBJ6119802.1 hypothetical protein [Pontibacter sp. BT310]MBR0572231.1 hypothetical protein [Microvirga sp. STS03]MBW3366655.1 hypothetical protein [Pontibacter populi]
MRLLLITSTNLTSNPRLVKEMRLALSIGYDVTVVLFDLKQWTKSLEQTYQKEFKEVKFIYLSITRNSFNWLQTTLVHFFAKKLNSSYPLSLKLSAFASDKRSFLLTKKLKKLSHKKFDLIISHNLGALYPAFQYANKHNIPFAFDVEDYHPGEVIPADAEGEKMRREFLMQQMLPQAEFITAASPLIANQVGKLCQCTVTTINNSFYSSEFKLSLLDDAVEDKIKLVWFSQHINHGRGLELLLPALDMFNDIVGLTLIGNLNQDFGDSWLKGRGYVGVIAPLPQNELHEELSKYDAGLALELKSVDFNRDIALTNKIFAYKQAGLFILATDTQAQSEFMNQYKEDGYVCEQTIESLKAGVDYIIQNISAIRAGKNNRFNAAIKIGFETEAQKLVALWQDVLK